MASRYSATAGLYPALRNGTVAKMPPISVKETMLKSWKHDTRAMAEMLVKTAYDVDRGLTYLLPVGGYTYDRDEAVAKWIEHLNSPYVAKEK